VKAAYYSAPGSLSLADVARPTIRQNEFLIRPRATSICGTDLRILKNGHFKIPEGTRRVLGHEIAGEIVEVGQLVENFEVGMRVSIPPNIGCGTCEFCRTGYNNMCPYYEAFGISIDGGFEEYMRVPHKAIAGGNIFEIPDGTSYAAASLAEPLSCCYNALRSVGTTDEDVVVIIGAGPMGAMHVMLHRIAGAKRIIVANRSEDRLDAIERFGVDATINTSKRDLVDAVFNETEGRGADVVLTSASSAELQSQAVQLLATHGRVNFFAGLGGNRHVSIDTNRVHYRGLVLTGTTGSTNADYYKSLMLIAEGRAEVEELVTETFPLTDINAAFEHALSSRGMKTMIVNE
jgi:threonine dehydrogenase-like Zn-dependent dehydrogenase